MKEALIPLSCKSMKIAEIIKKISLRKCLLCNKNLDFDLKKKDWNIPLCKNHRSLFLDESVDERRLED